MVKRLLIVLCIGLLVQSCLDLVIDERSGESSEAQSAVSSGDASGNGDNSVLIDANGCTLGDWWDSQYLYRQSIQVSVPKGEPVPKGYSFALPFDHQRLVAASRAHPTGRDIRMVHLSENCLLSEIPFVLDPSSSWNRSNTKIWFASAEDIPDDQTVFNYYIYYGNSAAAIVEHQEDSVFIEFEDFIDPPAPGTFSSLEEGAGISYLNGNLVVAGTTDEINQFKPFGIFRTVNGVELPAGTIIETSLTIPDTGGAEWKATVGAPSLMLGVYQNRVQYYTDVNDGEMVFWTPLSETIFPGNIVDNQRISLNVQPDNLSLQLNGSVIGTRDIETIGFQPRFTFSPSIAGATFEAHFHFYLARKAISTDALISLALGNIESR
ncbi:MAG: hypothetical protein HRU19_05650 [Pseudobacteriovorax sp.]|nr:hypothetical protein [Pseudobacteriovorax sp.]